MTKKQVMQNNQKIALGKRLGTIDDRQGKIPTHTFLERTRKAMNGERCDNLDVNPLINQLKRSISLPLNRLCRKEALLELEEKFYSSSGVLADGQPFQEDCGDRVDEAVRFPTTYGEGARIVRDAWKNREIRGKPFHVTGLADRAWVIMNLYMEIFLNEMARRNNCSSRQFPGLYSDVTKVFPIVSMPLPLYFKAAAAGCGDENSEEYMSSLYVSKFRPLLTAGRYAGAVREKLRRQPNKDTGYCDPVSAMGVVTKARKDNVITEEDFWPLMYDLMIRPCLTDR